MLTIVENGHFEPLKVKKKFKQFQFTKKLMIIVLSNFLHGLVSSFLTIMVLFCCRKDGSLAKKTVGMFGAFDFVGIMGASVSDIWEQPEKYSSYTCVFSYPVTICNIARPYFSTYSLWHFLFTLWHLKAKKRPNRWIRKD